MVKKLAQLFGAVLTAVGILGFIPALTPGGELLGLFEVDTLHNLIHLASGLVALYAAKTSPAYAKMYFKVFGVIYGVVTLAGFVQGDTVLGLIGVNSPDNILHLAIAGVALYVGFGKME